MFEPEDRIEDSVKVARKLISMHMQRQGSALMECNRILKFVLEQVRSEVTAVLEYVKAHIEIEQGIIASGELNSRNRLTTHQSDQRWFYKEVLRTLGNCRKRKPPCHLLFHTAKFVVYT